MKLKKGDKVKLLAGKDRGKAGKILNINEAKGTVLVEGINLYKKHQRPKKQGEKGEIVTLPRPVRISNVNIVCGSCGKAARIGMRIEGDKRSRYCKKCGAIL